MPFSKQRASTTIRGLTVLLTDSEKMILYTLRMHPDYTLNNVSEETGLSRSYVGKAVTKLKGVGLVECVGSNKSGIWKVRE